jgi:hypothetical protein
MLDHSSHLNGVVSLTLASAMDGVHAAALFSDPGGHRIEVRVEGVS